MSSDAGYVERLERQNREQGEAIRALCDLFLTKENSPIRVKSIDANDFWSRIDPKGALRYNFRKEGYNIPSREMHHSGDE